MPFGTLAHQVAKLVWYVRTPSWNMGMPYSTFACLLALWYVKISSWHAFGTLSHKPRWRASTLASKPFWNVGVHGTRFSKLIHEYQHKPTRVNTNQHESKMSQHEYEKSQHESIRVNTSQCKSTQVKQE